MTEERETRQEFRQTAKGQGIAQAGPNGIAMVNEIKYNLERPKDIDPSKLAEALNRLDELPVDREVDAGGLPAGSKPPPKRSYPPPVGREEDFKALAAMIKDDSSGPPTVVVSGTGGVGKTRFANEFVHRYGRYFAGGVYWLDFSDNTSVPDQIARCGGTEAMNLRADFHTLPPDERVGAVMSEWHNEMPRLLVLDDCADGQMLEAARPKTGGCRLLVTRRGPLEDPDLGTVNLALDPLDRASSVKLLLRYYDTPDEDGLGEIASKLGDLPLALELAGRHLRGFRHITNPKHYLRELRSEEVLGHRSLKEVGLTFVVSIRQLEQGDAKDLLALRLLARAACFKPEAPIDRELFRSTLDREKAETTQQQSEEREEAMALLIDLGLVKGLESGDISMHVLVAEAARQEIEDAEAQTAVERTVASTVIKILHQGQPARLEPLMPHLRYMVDAVGSRDDEPAYMVRFATGHALNELGYSAEALPYLKSAVEYNEARLKAATDPSERYDLNWRILRQRSDVALTLNRAGNSDEALAEHELVLEDRRNSLRQPHEDVASSLLNIGVIKAKRRLLHEVLPLYEETLDIRERVLARKNDDDPEKKQLYRDVAASHGNLAALSMDLGRVDDAASHFRQARTIRKNLKETEGKHHAGYTMGLGVTLRLLGDFEGSRKYLREALCIHKRVLPEESPEIAKNLTLLAALLAREAFREEERPGDRRDDGEEILDEAGDCLDEALDLFRQEPGEDHSFTAEVIRLSADVAEAQSRPDHASSLRATVMNVRETVLQTSDADFLDKLANSFTAHGLYDEAELYKQQALNFYRLADREGPEVADAEFTLGCLLLLIGRNDAASRHLRQALEIRDSLYGPGDPATELVQECLDSANEGRDTKN